MAGGMSEVAQLVQVQAVAGINNKNIIARADADAVSDACLGFERSQH